MLATRIAAVRYLNTAPLIEGLERLQGLTLLPAVPSRIADMVIAREADIGLCSIVDCIGETPLTLIPSGMISCDGPTLTVRLYSSVPFEQMTTLSADTDSHTSVILAQVLLRKLFSVAPRVASFHVRERMPVAPGPNSAASDDPWPQSLLMIGDKVVTDSPPAVRFPHQLDLGEAWRKLTGLPFVYAMWMCRADRATDPAIATAAALLDRQRRHNATRLDWIVHTRAPHAGWPIDLATQYVGELLRYQVGSREREAVHTFLGMAAELKLLPATTPTWRD
jgi:chorismate dehydratase